ncbi:cholesterol oxidase [Nocardioides sp. Root190]|uniref:GMC family oxidoreductase n=1 Tax=Nocardioides sp. Root190 TaxID=1736488 RepID=UPI0006F63B8B|nr:GMC family oxidoreductase [Nocardioides sp. Root190]KRB76260.1 cholesterol oxidase [Nocardioides sp. Root190]
MGREMRTGDSDVEHDYDVVVVGSGFGGSVTALRLTEKGYRVCVVEAGRRFEDEDFAKTSWDVRKFLFAPRLGCFGIQRIRLLRDVVVLAGAGVGGGSLVYANTLYEPASDAFFEDPQWAHITDWKAELAPYYDQAKRMLGVVENPTVTPSDEVMLAVAEDMGIAHTYHPTPIGVCFGADGAKQPGSAVPDPYFGGVGPERRGCLECGECMTGCRHNAKNTLLKNYLYLAEKAGAEVRERTTVAAISPRTDGGYDVTTHRSGRSARGGRVITAGQVVMAAGTWGTQELMHAMKRSGDLPELSERLGELTRTNSEALCASSTKMRNKGKHDFHHGVAITSSIHPDPVTHIEPVRYGKGSGLMGLLLTLMTDGGGRVPRWLRWLGQAVRHPARLLSVYAGLGSWPERTIIALVMQTSDNSITVFPKKGKPGRRARLTSKQGHGEPNPTWVPVGNEVVRRISDKIDGGSFSTAGEIFNIPMTAHFLGGCPIGDSATAGVIDPYHRVHGHPGLHVVDGAAISANLGVNPSLTITAQAERAASLWPNRGEQDHRPEPGAAYVRLSPVAPVRPVVPPSAPAALRLPLYVVESAPSPALKEATA